MKKLILLIFIFCLALSITASVNQGLPLIFLDPSPAFLIRMTPANPASKSHKYTDDTPPSKYNSRYCDKDIMMKL